MRLFANERMGISAGAKIRYWEYSLVGIVLFMEAFLLQWFGGALSSEYGAMYDEPSHYVTALMVHEYLLSGDYKDPIGFAENYYAQYPKVAIGHWPPVFYALLGAWFILFGVSRISAMSFIAFLAVITGTIIYHIAKSQFGKHAAIFAAALFLALPFVQQLTGVVMLGHLVTLFSLVSIIFLAKFLSAEKIFYGFLFSMFAALAILTRGSAWAIGLMPLLTMLFAWRFNMLRRPLFWVLSIPVLILCLPWYLNMPSLNVAGAFMGGAIFNMEFTWQAIPHFAQKLFEAVGVVIFIPIIIGVYAKLIFPLLTKKQVDFIWPALAALVVATYIMHVLIAAALDSRYMLVTMPALVLFAVAGIEWVIEKFKPREYRKYLCIATYMIVGIIFFATKFSISDTAIEGYSVTLSEISKQLKTEQHTILIASDINGEGTIIAAAAAQRRPEDYLLRGSKLFVDQDWIGRVLKEKYQSATEITELLNKVPVNAVILDTSISAKSHRYYHRLLETILFDESSKWRSIGKISIARNGVKTQDALLIFVSKESNDPNLTKEVDVEFVKTLYGLSNK